MPSRCGGGHQCHQLCWAAAPRPAPRAARAHATELWGANFVNVHCHGDSIDQLKEHMVLYSFELSLEGVDWGIYLVFSFQWMTKDKEIKLV